MARAERDDSLYDPRSDSIIAPDTEVDEDPGDSAFERPREAGVEVANPDNGPEDEALEEEAGNDAGRKLAGLPNVQATRTPTGYSYFFIPPAQAVALGWATAIHLGDDDGSGSGTASISDQALSLTEKLNAEIIEYQEKGTQDAERDRQERERQAPLPGDEDVYVLAGATTLHGHEAADIEAIRGGNATEGIMHETHAISEEMKKEADVAVDETAGDFTHQLDEELAGANGRNSEDDEQEDESADEPLDAIFRENVVPQIGGDGARKADNEGKEGAGRSGEEHPSLVPAPPK